MNNGIKYEDMTEDQKVEYGFRVLSPQEIESARKRNKYIDSAPIVKRPIIGD